MNEPNRKLPIGLSIAGGILLLLVMLFNNIMQIAHWIQLWELGQADTTYATITGISYIIRSWVMIPVAIALFSCRKGVFAGCVFGYYSLDLLIGPALVSLLAGLLSNSQPAWEPTLTTFLAPAFFILIAIACFGWKKQLLRKARWLFIVLPLLLPPVATLSMMATMQHHFSMAFFMNLITYLVTNSLTCLPHLLISLAFFFSYPKKAQSAPRCCSVCGKQLDPDAKFCTECGLPIE